MKNNTFETLVGAIVILVAISFLSISSKIVNVSKKGNKTYEVYAEFSNIEGISIGSDVKISGVKVGTVSDIILNDSYKASLTIKLPENILIPTDSLFKISTSGLIGSKFINIKIGANEEYFADKEMVEFTESVMDLEDLISRFVFNSEKKDK